MYYVLQVFWKKLHVGFGFKKKKSLHASFCMLALFDVSVHAFAVHLLICVSLLGLAH